MKRPLKSFIKENWMLVLAVLYVLLPIDILPDVVPLFGSFDDAGIVLIELLRQYKKFNSTPVTP